jgi:saccharopine dehydrogenase-like NADP-dependent oxidoreductase
VPGQDETQTAMAKTVGLPLGIAAKLLLQGKIRKRGLAIPIHEEIYAPVLSELNTLGIVFVESERQAHNV